MMRAGQQNVYLVNIIPSLFTGVLILQNDKGLFLSQDLARANYQAELAEILHGTFLGDSTWVSRGVF